jgi:hypothetical protein
MTDPNVTAERGVAALARIAALLAVAITVAGVLVAALAAAFSPHYNVGDLAHDLALFALALGAVVFALRHTP